MTNHKKNDKSRRKFLSLGLLSGLGLIAGKTHAQKNPEKTETVKLLSPDGKLVEVDRNVLNKAARSKASNMDILNWTNPKGK